MAAGRDATRIVKHGKLHRHGSYKRHSRADGRAGEDLKAIFRYFCPLCGRTCSVLPDDMLPYRYVSTSKTQKHFDAVRGNKSLFEKTIY